MGWYECALGSGFVLAVIWSIVLSRRRNTLRKRSEQKVQTILTSLQGMETHSDSDCTARR